MHERIRKKILGTAERPRLNVYRSLNHIYVQLIDDLEGATLVSAQLRRRQKGRESAAGGNLAAAKTSARSSPSAPRPRESSKVVFDRGGYIYHGRVKALADSAAKPGLKF